jgi:general secretion pathway protein M
VNERTAALRALRAAAAARWAALAPRERRGLSLALLAVGLLLLWMVAVRPALGALGETPAQLDKLEVQMQQLQRIAAEARELKATAPVTPAQSGAALKAAAERLGDKAKLQQQGDRATLTLTNASPEALAAWLGEARSAARARPVEAQLTRSAQGYSGSVVVQVGGNP